MLKKTGGNIVTAKAWLNRGWKLNSEIKQLVEAKNTIWEIATNATANPFEERVKTSRQNTSEIRMAKILDYGMEIECQIERLVAILREILCAINTVEDVTCRTLLIARYVNFKTWEDIADTMGFSYAGIQKIHKKALNCIQRYIEVDTQKVV